MSEMDTCVKDFQRKRNAAGGTNRQLKAIKPILLIVGGEDTANLEFAP